MKKYRVLVKTDQNEFITDYVTVLNDNQKHTEHGKALFELLERIFGVHGEMDKFPSLHVITASDVFRLAGTELAYYMESEANNSGDNKYIFFRKMKSTSAWFDIFPVFVDMSDEDIKYIKETWSNEF